MVACSLPTAHLSEVAVAAAVAFLRLSRIVAVVVVKMIDSRVELASVSSMNSLVSPCRRPLGLVPLRQLRFQHLRPVRLRRLWWYHLIWVKGQMLMALARRHLRSKEGS